MTRSSQICEAYSRIRRIPKKRTSTHYTHYITGDNYSTPTALMDGNNSDDNQDTRMWSSRIEMKLINMLKDEVQKNQTTGSTVWTVRHWTHFATELQNLYGFRYTPKQF
ncbi:unnamed protein product [Camellia sinensis]